MYTLYLLSIIYKSNDSSKTTVPILCYILQYVLLKMRGIKPVKNGKKIISGSNRL